MSDTDLKALLTRRITELAEYTAKIHEQRALARGYLTTSEGLLDQAARDLTETNITLAWLTGAPLMPADITTDGIGLSIGGLVLAPPADATADQVRRHAGVMRELYAQATHAARAAQDLADDLDPQGAHVRGQAITPTGNLPVYVDPATGEADQAAVAELVHDALTADPDPTPGPGVGVDGRYVLAQIPSTRLPAALRAEVARPEWGLVVTCYTATAQDTGNVAAYLVRFRDTLLVWLDPARSRMIPAADPAALEDAKLAIDYLTAMVPARPDAPLPGEGTGNPVYSPVGLAPDGPGEFTEANGAVAHV